MIFSVGLWGGYGVVAGMLRMGQIRLDGLDGSDWTDTVSKSPREKSISVSLFSP